MAEVDSIVDRCPNTGSSEGRKSVGVGPRPPRKLCDRLLTGAAKRASPGG